MEKAGRIWALGVESQVNRAAWPTAVPGIKKDVLVLTVEVGDWEL